MKMLWSVSVPGWNLPRMRGKLLRLIHQRWSACPEPSQWLPSHLQPSRHDEAAGQFSPLLNNPGQTLTSCTRSTLLPPRHGAHLPHADDILTHDMPFLSRQGLEQVVSGFAALAQPATIDFRPSQTAASEICHNTCSWLQSCFTSRQDHDKHNHCIIIWDCSAVLPCPYQM